MVYIGTFEVALLLHSLLRFYSVRLFLPLLTCLYHILKTKKGTTKRNKVQGEKDGPSDLYHLPCGRPNLCRRDWTRRGWYEDQPGGEGEGQDDGADYRVREKVPHPSLIIRPYNPIMPCAHYLLQAYPCNFHCLEIFLKWEIFEKVSARNSNMTMSLII